jgi:hypothetical protein
VDGIARGLVTAALSTLLIAVGHVLAGGAVPDLTLLVVLFPLLTAGVVGLAERARSVGATLATLGGGQYALHVLLAVMHPHPPVPGAPGGAAMLALHAVATLAVAALLRGADTGWAAAGAALGWLLRRVLPRRPFVPAAADPLPRRIAGPARPLRLLTRVAVPARRGPPVGC